MENVLLERPLFSIILAFRNEAEFIELCLRSFDEQSLSREKWEILLVDGDSRDGSRKIAEEYVKRHPNSRLVDNPAKIATAGWNRGVEAASGKFYHIANGHSDTDKDFLLKAEKYLRENPDVHALGGRIYKIGLNDVSAGISAAMNTPFAMGGSYYRIGTRIKKVNVIGQGIYLRELAKKIGPYDDSLGRSGDWEFNYRICANGFNMVFNPDLTVKVFSRAGYLSTFRQMFRTGFWKVKIWIKHPKSLLPRHIVPSFFMLWLISLIPVLMLAGTSLKIVWILPIFLYLFAVLWSLRSAMREKVKWYLVMPTYPVVHMAYGTGFLVGLVRWGIGYFKK